MHVALPCHKLKKSKSTFVGMVNAQNCPPDQNLTLKKSSPQSKYKYNLSLHSNHQFIVCKLKPITTKMFKPVSSYIAIFSNNQYMQTHRFITQTGIFNLTPIKTNIFIIIFFMTILNSIFEIIFFSCFWHKLFSSVLRLSLHIDNIVNI